MGVGISLSGLASAVANEGGIGVIAATGIGWLEPDLGINFKEANKRALSKEIKKARDMTTGVYAVLGEAIYVDAALSYSSNKVSISSLTEMIPSVL
ncbi:unnamed protein product [marine sediment metagenome]|uniref:Nitronate monooxygenase domain-containing protein n=1 Tax=marine sediment metagenome TaxID=412755 RepID=X1LAZ5_9ZZZZ